MKSQGLGELPVTWRACPDCDHEGHRQTHRHTQVLSLRVIKLYGHGFKSHCRSYLLLCVCVCVRARACVCVGTWAPIVKDYPRWRWSEGGGGNWGRIFSHMREVTRDWRQFRNEELHIVSFINYC